MNERTVLRGAALSEQRAFRCLLLALSYPERPAAAPAGEFFPGSCVLALSGGLGLVCLMGECDASLRDPWGLLRSAQAQEVDVVLAPAGFGPVERTLKRGTELDPDLSARLVLLNGGCVPGEEVRLTGPGVRGSLAVSIPGADRAFWEAILCVSHERNPSDIPFDRIVRLGPAPVSAC